MKAALKYFLIYLGLYFLGAIVLMIPAMIIESVVYNNDFQSDNFSGWTMSLIILGSQILPLYVFWKKKYCDLTFIKSPNFLKLLLWMAVGWLGCYLLIMVVQQYMPRLDWDIELLSDIGNMSLNPVGMICVCLLAGVVEESVFRGAIERKLLERDWNPWYAIVISALIFAVFHFNLAQGMTAFILGMFLGWVYYRTRNIWLCIFVHALNNTVSTIGYYLSDAPDAFTDIDRYPHYVNILMLLAAVVLLGLAARMTGKAIDSVSTDDDLQKAD